MPRSLGYILKECVVMGARLAQVREQGDSALTLRDVRPPIRAGLDVAGAHGSNPEGEVAAFGRA